MKSMVFALGIFLGFKSVSNSVRRSTNAIILWLTAAGFFKSVFAVRYVRNVHAHYVHSYVCTSTYSC